MWRHRGREEVEKKMLLLADARTKRGGRPREAFDTKITAEKIEGLIIMTH